MIRVDTNGLRRFVGDIFLRAGCPEQEALDIARYLVMANLTGHDSHGVVRVPVYLRWKEEGRVEAGKAPRIASETPVLAVVDGGFGFGQTMGPFAARLGIRKAKEMGLAAISLRDSGHVGRIGDFAEMAAAEGLVSIHFVTASGSLLVAPFGGVERKISTAPYCVGVPRAGGEPVILDFATSMVAEGKVLVASFGGKKLPHDALIDPEGNLSDDPYQLYGDTVHAPARDHGEGKGAIRAFGEHKGSGLAIMCELLGGSLTGTGATREGKRFANGMFSIYVDPAKFDVADVFDADVARYVASIRESKPISGVDEVLTPGDPERRSRADREAKGVPLSVDAWTSIVNAAFELGLTQADVPATRKE